MTIETKYNIGDEVWYIAPNGKIKAAKIKAISYHAFDESLSPHKTKIAYFFKFVVGYKAWYLEEELYPTKEELLKSL